MYFPSFYFNCFQVVRAASTFPLVNLTKVSTAAHSMYFSNVSVELGSPLILVMAPESLVASFTPTSERHGMQEPSRCVCF